MGTAAGAREVARKSTPMTSARTRLRISCRRAPSPHPISSTRRTGSGSRRRAAMRAKTVDVKSSNGRILCCTVFRTGGKKLLAKGHVISDEDIRVLESEGMENVWVTELEEGEIGEDEAVCTVATEMGCGCYEIRMAAGGRANLVATENCCVLVDEELLKQFNCTASVGIATTLDFSFALAGQRIATVKTTPLAGAKEQLEALIAILKDRGPILQARPVRSPSIGILYTDPVNG